MNSLEELLTKAVSEPPPTRVTAAAIYQRGRRRRRVVRACTAGGAAVLLGAGAVGVAQLAPGGGSSPSLPTGAAAPRLLLDPLPEPPANCVAFAEAVEDVAEATLPVDIRWTGTRVPDGAGDQCADGGLIWVTFSAEGRTHTLGFEGGSQAQGGEPCDTARAVARCEEDGPYTIGHYENADDYGVLLGSPATFFFVGLSEGGADPALTTDQLAAVAKEIARVIFGE